MGRRYPWLFHAPSVLLGAGARVAGSAVLVSGLKTLWRKPT